jgi:CRISPR/Cas system endoribonuclease Cas6 (RAMP superfamily)
MVQKTRVEQYVQDEGIIITDYNLKAHQVTFTTHVQPGFIGTCTYALQEDREPATNEAPLTIQQQIMLLADLAFYCGIGYKTAMGMGQARHL